jgi:hypothetical protein
MGKRRHVYRDLFGKLGGKRPLGRLKHRLENNTKMNLQDLGCGSMDWIVLAQDKNRWLAVVNEVMNLRLS